MRPHPHAPGHGLGPDVPKAPITRENLRELWQFFGYLAPYRWGFALAWSCLLINAACGLAIPWVGGRMIDTAQRGLASDGGAAGALTQLAWILAAVVLVRIVFQTVQILWSSRLGEQTMCDLRRDTYTRVIQLPMGFFAQRRVGELTSRISGDLSQIQSTLVSSIPQFLTQLVTLVGAVVLLAITSPRLTAIVLVLVPVAVGTARMFGQKARALARESQDRLAETNVVVEESLQGIGTVKAFAREEYETERYSQGLDKVLAAVVRGARHQAVFSAAMSVFFMGILGSVLVYGCRLIQTGELTVGQMSQFLLYSMSVSMSAGQLARLYNELQRMLGATQRVRELLREPTEPDPLVARLGARSSGAESRNVATLPRIRGEVEFRRVEFAYPARPEVPVLRGLSLEAHSGQRIALVGPSGAGKSTVVSLLMRFYEPQAGQVLIDGRNVREYPLRALRSQMAIVPQDVLLFGGTIAENIAYGRPGATAAEIEEAARKANAHDFIAGFPEGYQTVVGERGVKLSGGQRQRVAIARAILRDPAILILDEATSSLDSESESLVQQALETLMEGRTSIIIAHRLATVRRADCISVIRDGEVVEAGTHEELMQQPEGLYRTLSELQFTHELAETPPSR
jgi:ATP-binding cassette subfamily B protein